MEGSIEHCSLTSEWLDFGRNWFKNGDWEIRMWFVLFLIQGKENCLKGKMLSSNLAGEDGHA